MCNFLKEDVLKLAETIVDCPVEYQDGDYGSYYCNYCEAELDCKVGGIKDFKHNLNCPVLIAQDILTRSKP